MQTNVLQEIKDDLKILPPEYAIGQILFHEFENKEQKVEIKVYRDLIIKEKSRKK
jgi:hypothetical protein